MFDLLCYAMIVVLNQAMQVIVCIIHFDSYTVLVVDEDWGQKIGNGDGSRK